MTIGIPLGVNHDGLCKLWGAKFLGPNDLRPDDLYNYNRDGHRGSFRVGRIPGELLFPPYTFTCMSTSDIGTA